MSKGDVEEEAHMRSLLIAIGLAAAFSIWSATAKADATPGTAGAMANCELCEFLN